MSPSRDFLWVNLLGILMLMGCRRDAPPGEKASAPAGSPVPAASSSTASSASPSSWSDVAPNAPSPALVPPTRLLSLPVSAYDASVALDGDTILLFTPNTAYRLAPGQAPLKSNLDLGYGPVLTESGIVFWAKGAIWNASKVSGALTRLASLPSKPAYFVVSSAGLAWLERTDKGLFAIESLYEKKPRLLVAEHDQLSAVTMIHDGVFFVRRAEDKSWRIGRVDVGGGEAQYTDPRTGPTPASLTGTESVVYYDMGKSEIRQLMPDLKNEQVWLKNFVCSPMHEATNVYCACVEGLFMVARESHKPRILAAGGGPITFVQADSKQVAWIVDLGRNQMAVDWLPVR